MSDLNSHEHQDPEFDALERAITVANVPTLVCLLVQLTGDVSWLEAPYVMARTKGMADNDSGGLSEELQGQVRAAALKAIVDARAGAELAIPVPSPELMVRMLSASMGEDVPLEYGHVLQHELRAGLGTREVAQKVDAPAGYRALVVGAGISGIAAGVTLDAIGVEYEILEKADGIGGVWLENTYPGAGVDTPSHLYSYSFAPHDWTRYFAAQGEILDYVRAVADELDVVRKVRFGTEVVQARWDSEELVWRVTVRGHDGEQSELTANVLLSCVGAFNPPVVPDIPGLDQFEGAAFHTARWPADLDITGKRVVVVGNGASAMQVVPAIADKVADLAIYQRSPQWVQPFEKFMKPVPESMRLLFETVPLFRAWYRLRLSWIFHDKLYESLQRDPAWLGRGDAINDANAFHRKYFTRYIESEIGDRPDLLAKVVPDYPPFGKRMLQDNGWFKTLLRPNVNLIAGRVSEVGPDHVIGDDGVVTPADVIVLATGFDVTRFVSSFDVIGRDGKSLRDAWDGDDCRAYLGLFVAGFPNFATIYGPNTQTGHGGSLIHTVEAQLHYVADLVRETLAMGAESFECKREVYDDYSDEVDELHERMIWTHPGMSTYYRNDRGRVVAISPFRNVDYWARTRNCNLEDFDLASTSATLNERPDGHTTTLMEASR